MINHIEKYLAFDVAAGLCKRKATLIASRLLAPVFFLPWSVYQLCFLSPLPPKSPLFSVPFVSEVTNVVGIDVSLLK